MSTEPSSGLPDCFNPRTRVGCDPRGRKAGQAKKGFNPRTRVGCDVGSRGRGANHPQVSIHAPAWGATEVTSRMQRVLHVSIHAPAWGATSIPSRDRTPLEMFQSTHPRGVRQVPVADGAGLRPVSIHAPAWGATARFITWTAAASSFNPRTRVGCDTASFERLRYHAGFNPRTRVGCDVCVAVFR